jgi:hypothetical protein
VLGNDDYRRCCPAPPFRDAAKGTAEAVPLGVNITETSLPVMNDPPPFSIASR